MPARQVANGSMNEYRVSSRNYNYAHFEFSQENPAKVYWRSVAPALGTVMNDFELLSLDGTEWRLSTHLGAPVVIECGSYTCPIFCSRISAMEDLASEYDDTTFVVVYVREAHPGEVTPPHSSLDEKRACASRLVAAESIRRTVLIDDIGGSVHLALGASPNPVFVLDSQGRLVLRRRWNEPTDVRRCLLALSAGRHPTPSEAMGFGAPCERSPSGEEILKRGGIQALTDFSIGAPSLVRRMLEASTPQVQRHIQK